MSYTHVTDLTELLVALQRRGEHPEPFSNGLALPCRWSGPPQQVRIEWDAANAWIRLSIRLSAAVLAGRRHEVASLIGRINETLPLEGLVLRRRPRPQPDPRSPPRGAARRRQPSRGPRSRVRAPGRRTRCL